MRLLNVEEKPFKRITKRLLIPNSLIAARPTLPPTPPPDGSGADEAAAAHEIEKQQQLDERRQWREDVLLDFAAFESSIVRIQLLRTSNFKEGERYAAEKLKIQATAQAVRDNTAELRVQLEDAQKRLALRKEYDDLAEKITSNRLLRPREDQHANLNKLDAEILELERESQEYAQTWAERRQQFGKIIEEGMQLRRLIRDEKEEVERREGMEEDREDNEEGETASQRGRSSGLGTPRHAPDNGGGLTPLLAAQEQHDRGSTPAGGLLAERDAPLLVEKSPLRNAHMIDPDKTESHVSEDTDMAEDGEVSGESDLSATAPAEEGLIADEEDDAKEEGEQEDDETPTQTVAEQMDTS
ncbi:hypothetical protein MMC07_009907 [Pseudocyphellaria aurata]|nr:hypothetical protein [Pseudocyphellaria aurata]